jgi:hypothetical protein
VFRYAVATGSAESDPSRDLRGAPDAVETPALRDADRPDERLAGSCTTSKRHEGTFATNVRDETSPMLFVRAGELRHGRVERDRSRHAEWRIPAAKMKSGCVHIVPLARQAVQS